MGFFKNMLHAYKKTASVVPEEYRGPSGMPKFAKDSAEQLAQGADLMVEMKRVAEEHQRLMSVGTPGTATITAIRENVAETGGVPWHDIDLRVGLPGREPYPATRRVMVNLATVPDLVPGAQVPVRVDPDDESKVLIAKTLT